MNWRLKSKNTDQYFSERVCLFVDEYFFENFSDYASRASNLTDPELIELDNDYTSVFNTPITSSDGCVIALRSGFFMPQLYFTRGDPTLPDLENMTLGEVDDEDDGEDLSDNDLDENGLNLDCDNVWKYSDEELREATLHFEREHIVDEPIKSTLPSDLSDPVTKFELSNFEWKIHDKIQLNEYSETMVFIKDRYPARSIRTLDIESDDTVPNKKRKVAFIERRDLIFDKYTFNQLVDEVARL